MPVNFMVVFSLITHMLLISLPSIASATQTVTLVYNSEPNPPFNMGNHLLEKPGATFEVLNKVASKLNLKINFIRMPWKRCLYAVKTNKADGTIDASFKEERLTIGVYPMKNNKLDQTRRNNTQQYSIFTTPNSNITRFDDLLDNKRVSVTLGYSVISELYQKGIPPDNLTETKGSLSSLNMLISGRVDAIVDLDTNIENQRQRYQSMFNKVIKISPPVISKNYYLLFSYKFVSNNKALANQIWTAIAQIRDSKDYQEILNHYF
ncbi:substrate-binding periplasmic protein [Zooshikella harenae]|uniref:Transporter substrate-binding domain-containing protein n=1 Tax=Zooshikella harenae TaxID=2827238 RepID=A0ABS5Z6G5_9GAMM|nr:transporter substrate-binding domain-containing protein [Zooshikella harenae]MBU2709641.1 transporter substrate-binding domain-containing protein [Zooshikella harenae]